MRYVALLFAGVVVFGAMADLFSGLPLLRLSRSWTAWLLGVAGLGIVYAVAELGGGWITGRDKLAHPLWKRAFHLAMLLGMGVVLWILAEAVMRAAM
jgi:hypothetical protein